MKTRKTQSLPETQVATARKAIARLETTLNQGDNRYGEYGRNCREAIARWQAVIDRETNK
jgi:hypothetical protein